MTNERSPRPLKESLGEPQPRPWYREPWPWVLIAIPAVAVIASLATLYLALANPDYVVLDVERYQEIRAELRAQAHTADDGSTDGESAEDQPADRETAGETAPAEHHGDR